MLEDLHWAEPTLLDLLDYLAVFSSGHPILLVCVARPELLEARPAWAQPGHRCSCSTRSRRPTRGGSSPHAGELAPGAAERIVETAEGNPLFLEQLVAVGADRGRAADEHPGRAGGAARAARPGERALLEDASVQGRSFYAARSSCPRRPRPASSRSRSGS